jgi:hypothetical protein
MGETLIIPFRNSIKVPLQATVRIKLLPRTCFRLIQVKKKTNGHSPLDRNIQVRNVMQYEARQLLVLFLAQPLDEAVAWKRFSEPKRRKPILGKTEIKNINHCLCYYSILLQEEAKKGNTV